MKTTAFISTPAVTDKDGAVSIFLPGPKAEAYLMPDNSLRIMNSQGWVVFAPGKIPADWQSVYEMLLRERGV